MRRWLKFEIYDLEAIIEAVDKSHEMEKRKTAKIKQRNSDQDTLRTLKDGKDTFTSFFRSKEGKVNKITELTESISKAERDIECLDLLHKIVVLQLNQAAINFFKREKFGTYNHTLNLYAVKVIENNSIKHQYLKKLQRVNSETKEDHLNASVADYRKTNRITDNSANSNMGYVNGKNLAGKEPEMMAFPPAAEQPAANENEEKRDLFIGVAQTVNVDQENTMAVQDQFEVEDLQKDISAQMAKEEAENMMMPANFDDTLPTQANPLSGTQRNSIRARANEKDNLLKY